MNILGIGGPELLIILLLTLIIAGPKRMIKWAYVMGTYVAKFRRMWSETVDILQHEFDEAGVDVKLPHDLPTRGSLNREVGKALSPITDPVKDTLGRVDTEVKQITQSTVVASQTVKPAARGTNGHASARNTTARSNPSTRASSASGQGEGFGSWSSHNARPDFGSWTANGQQPDNEE